MPTKSNLMEIAPVSPPERAAYGSRGLAREREAWTETLDEENGNGKVLGEPAVADAWASAVSRWVVDASLISDVGNLHAGLEVLRRAHGRLSTRGEVARLESMLTVLGEVARAGLDRARQAWLIETLDPTTWAARMLLAMDESPGITSAQLAERLEVAPAQISRSGAALIERGLSAKTRHGRERRWVLTARGAVAVQSLRGRMSDPGGALPKF